MSFFRGKARVRDFVVYTVLTGAYDPLSNPFPEGATGFERICFTDDPNLVSSNWDVVLLEDSALDTARESRRPKLLPHRFLEAFEWSLYLDNNVRLKVNPVDIRNDYASSDTRFVCFSHPWRSCIYDEAEEVIRLGIESERRVREQMDYYRSKGFPPNYGLIAGGVILRRHSEDHLVNVSEEWFEHVLRFSKRDQLSFNYVAWRHGFAFSRFPGELERNELVEYPFPGLRRPPKDFSDETYLWLNPDVARSGVVPRQHYLSHGQAENRRYATYRWDLDRLANKYQSDKGSLYFNAHAYAAVYESYLARIRSSELHLLELGLLRHDVQALNPDGPYDNTPSLKMWREYLPNAKLVGFDIADFSTAPALPGVQIVRGDMGDTGDLQRLVEAAGGPFDVIIDDGSHASHHQQIALATLYPYLKPGGLYFIEDLGYQPPQWEKPDATKTRDMLKKVACGRPKPTAYFKDEPFRLFCDTFDSIEFYDSHDRQFGRIGADALAAIRRRL